MSDTTITAAIEQAVTDPAAVSIDGMRVDARPIPELIAADNHLAKKTAATNRRLPITCFRIRPPGAV